MVLVQAGSHRDAGARPPHFPTWSTPSIRGSASARYTRGAPPAACRKGSATRGGPARLIVNGFTELAQMWQNGGPRRAAWGWSVAGGGSGFGGNGSVRQRVKVR